MPSRSYVQRAAAQQRRRYRRVWGPSISTEPLTVTFPTTPLRSQARIALDADLSQSWLTWSWLDITDRVRWDDGIETSHGRREQSDRVDSAWSRLKVDNRDGALSRKNPLSPWYGMLSRATPLWLALDPGTGFADMFHGFLVDLPKRWDRSATDSVIFVTARGLMHLLLRRQPLRSPMFYSVSGVAEGDFVPVAYWPMEDGQNATQIASGLAGGTPAAFTGDVVFGSAEDMPGSFPLPFLDSGAVISGSLPTYTGTQWFFQVALRIDEPPSSNTTYLEIDTPGGDDAVWRLYIEPDTPDIVWFVGYDSDGVQTGEGTGVTLSGGDPAAPSEDDFYGNWWLYSLFVYVDPDDGFVYGGMTLTDNGDFSGSSAGSGTNTVMGTATQWRIFGGNGVAAGHAAFFTDPTFGVFQAVSNAGAMDAWDGEMAHERIERLCREQGITLHCTALTSAVLGPQPRGTLLEVLRDAEKADQGVLYEHEFGLAYQALNERYNQPVAFTADIAEGQVVDDLEPDDNDLRYRNQWTAKRTDGSEATVQGRDGEAGITLQDSDPLYEAEDTFSVGADGQLPHLAGWLVHRDSLEEDYWPNVGINLAKTPELIGDWLGLRFGQRVNVTNVMDQAGVDTIDALREGYAQRWNSKEWLVRMNTAPATTYDVGTCGDSVTAGSWAQTSDDTQLQAELASGGTSATAMIDGPLFSTEEDLDSTPLSIIIGGEVMPVAAITSALADAFGDAVVSGWDVADTGQTWTVSGSGTASVSGGFGRQSLTAGQTVLCSAGVSLSDVDLVLEGTDISATPAGDNVEVGARLRVTNSGNNYVQCRTFRQPGGGVTINLNEVVNGSQTAATGFPTVSGVTSTDSIDIHMQLDGTTFRARAFLTGGTEPTTWDVELTVNHVTGSGDVTVRGMLGSSWSGASPCTVLYDGIDVSNPQTFTVTRTLAKTHPAGSQLAVHRPLIAAY